MKYILSIQSHVAFGYVGNRAAVFPLQRLGHDVTAVNTVQFSNHTGYGTWEGDIFSVDHIKQVLHGVNQRRPFIEYDAFLSGYLGDKVLGEVILEQLQQTKRDNANLIYCCDPVLGDTDRGLFVKPEVASFHKEESIWHADIITPNQFELAYLTDHEITDLTSALQACQFLHQQNGPEIILLTSFLADDSDPKQIEMLVSSPTQAWKVSTPYLPLSPAPNGAGDATAAIFLAKYLETGHVESALSHVASAIYAVFSKTYESATRELQLIRAQDEIIAPQTVFDVELIKPIGV